MTRLPAYFVILAAVLTTVSACNTQRYAVAPVQEDDDLYYFPGSIYVDEAASNDATAEAQQEEEYYEEDYYDENASAPYQPGFSPNGGFGYGNNSGFRPNGTRFRLGMSMGFGNGMFRPMGGYGMGMNSFGMSCGMGMPMGGFGMQPMMPSNYFYGYSAFGSPMYDPWYGGMGGFYDPWYNNSMCFGNNFYNPYAFGGMWGSPYGNYWGNPYINNGFGGWNPWMGDMWGQNNNTVYGQRTPITTGSNSNSGYTGGSVYDGTTPRMQDQEGANTDYFGTRPMQQSNRGGDVLDTPNIGDRPSTQSRQNDYDYFDTRRPAQGTNPAGRQNNANPANNRQDNNPPPTNNRQNNRQNNFFDNFFNNGGGTSPSTTPRGGSRPNYTPRGGSKPSGGSTTPSSGSSRGSFGGSSSGSSRGSSTGTTRRR